MSAPRLYASGELEDGTTWTGLPVPIATRVQAEQTGHAKGWNLETHSMTMSAFMSWHVSRARGVHSLKWEDFIGTAVAADVDDNPGDDTGTDDEGDPEERPTQTAP